MTPTSSNGKKLVESIKNNPMTTMFNTASSAWGEQVSLDKYRARGYICDGAEKAEGDVDAYVYHSKDALSTKLGQFLQLIRKTCQSRKGSNFGHYVVMGFITGRVVVHMRYIDMLSQISSDCIAELAEDRKFEH